MLFSSLLFLFLFLPLVLVVYYLMPRRLRNAVLFAANLIFYGFGEPVFVLLMLFSVALNWGGGLWISRLEEASPGRKAVLILTVCMNLLLIGIFKYAGLIGDTLRLIPPLAGLPILEIPLPIGISFYTFQAMSYVIDVYRGDCAPQRSALRFGTYISLFPQLIAGPIVRYRDVADQLEDPFRESAALFSEGAGLFLVGLAKKVLLANPMGEIWTALTGDPACIGTLGAWAGLWAFSMQLYFDFSGYSDMARGLGKLFGFEFCENFRYPYTARSMTDFWKRWHLSLTTWFRDYVYIPLGGSRRGSARTLLNLLIVWFLTGLWHGASWNFVLWGLYNFVLLVLERQWLGKLLQRKGMTVPAHLYALLAIHLIWPVFGIDSFAVSRVYYRAMFTLSAASPETLSLLWGGLPTAIIGVAASLPEGRRMWLRIPEKPRAALSGLLCLLALVLCTGMLVNDSYNPFLYFRF